MGHLREWKGQGVSEIAQPWRKMQACEKNDMKRKLAGSVYPRYEKLAKEYFGE